MDVTQLLASSIRLVQKVETSLLFKPAATFSSFGGASTMSSFTGGGADSAFPGLGKVYDEETLNGILSNSVDNVSSFVSSLLRSLVDWFEAARYLRRALYFQWNHQPNDRSTNQSSNQM